MLTQHTYTPHIYTVHIMAAAVDNKTFVIYVGVSLAYVAVLSRYRICPQLMCVCVRARLYTWVSTSVSVCVCVHLCARARACVCVNRHERICLFKCDFQSNFNDLSHTREPSVIRQYDLRPSNDDKSLPGQECR